MSKRRTTEWSDVSWNPVRGCTKISAGCAHCYAEQFAERFRGVIGNAYEKGFEPRLVPESLDLPKRWRRPRVVFVNSMSDLFHEHFPLQYIRDVFQVMRECPRHAFQVLTKRSARLVEVSSELPWSQNVRAGVTVENDDYRWRIDDLRKVPAAIRFLSLEPMLGALPDLDLTGIHWVIVGGETGPGARYMQPEWVEDVRDQCAKANVAFFFKQWSRVRKKERGRLLNGRTWDEKPTFPP